MEWNITYVWRRYRYDPSLIPRLHYRRVDTFDSIGQGVEIGSEKLMFGEIIRQDVEELQQSRRYVLR